MRRVVLRAGCVVLVTDPGLEPSGARGEVPLLDCLGAGLTPVTGREQLARPWIGISDLRVQLPSVAFDARHGFQLFIAIGQRPFVCEIGDLQGDLTSLVQVPLSQGKLELLCRDTQPHQAHAVCFAFWGVYSR